VSAFHEVPMMYINWGISLLSMLVSLIFSEFLKLPPCSLCWYQRVFMYSLVFVLPTGIILRDSKIGYYTSVLSFFGALVALYHNLIYYNIISEGMKVCTADLSCKSRQLEVLGFVTIPMMSLVAFLIILFLSVRSLKNENV
jgi:disulfide bond formation protein DsbB